MTPGGVGRSRRRVGPAKTNSDARTGPSPSPEREPRVALTDRGQAVSRQPASELGDARRHGEIATTRRACEDDIAPPAFARLRSMNRPRRSPAAKHDPRRPESDDERQRPPVASRRALDGSRAARAGRVQATRERARRRPAAWRDRDDASGLRRRHRSARVRLAAKHESAPAFDRRDADSISPGAAPRAGCRRPRGTRPGSVARPREPAVRRPAARPRSPPAWP